MESDCANLVAKVIERREDRSVNSAMISDIKIAVSGSQSCLIQNVSRHQNHAAHNLA
jgi:hypothetical protein